MIDQRQADIQALEKDIASYQTQIDGLGDQETSLSSTLKSLDLTQKKLAANIKVTEDKISAQNLEIQKLGSQIGDTAVTIDDDQRIITHALMTVNERGSASVIEMLLASGSLSDTWDSLDQLGKLQGELVSRIADLRDAKASLESNKLASEKARADLVTLGGELKGQQKAVLATASEKNQLLKDTKQSESQYQKILAQKQAQKDAFEREVLDYESQLHLGVKTSSLPHTGSGVLSWPLDTIRITQYFGNTPFATANPQIYNGKGHTGVDFGASIGTPVKAALSGVVVGVANTDIVTGCYSFGKWIMIKHADGLSTLYAHLSVQSASVGDTVTTGEIIGYSGNTGYTTGPHLHFGVYATDGVQIAQFTPAMSKNCVGATIPIADFKAYLNPLSYL